jgi:Uma2 family endonuclease
MATVIPPGAESRTVLYGVSWQTYTDLRESPENYHLHMTYDEGMLEFMSPSARHERHARFIDMIIGVWTEEQEIPIRGLRQMTCKREDLAKGLEPDDCYYIQNEKKMRNKDEVDFTVDPPPDLAIEVEVSRSSLKKAPIYAALGVRELWRYDGKALRIFELVEGRYQNRVLSTCLADFPIAKAEELLQQISEIDDTTLKQRFRRWVRKNFKTGHGE